MKKLLLFPAIFLLVSCDVSTQRPNDVQAENMAHQVVKARLDDPSDADFEGDGSKMAILADSSYVFNGIVTATNKLGLKAPLSYNVGIKFKDGNPMQDTSWTVEFCNIK